MKNILFDVINDVMVSMSRDNEFTRDGYIKISSNVLFDKYSFWLFIIGSFWWYRYFPIRSFPLNYNAVTINIIILAVLDGLIVINYIYRGRRFCTIYYKDNSIVVLNGFKHKMDKFSTNDIVDSNGYDGFRGYFRYMYFSIRNTNEKIYFNPLRKEERLINKIFREIMNA